MNLRIVNIKEETKEELNKVLKEIETIKQTLKKKEDRAFALQQALDWYEVASDEKEFNTTENKVVEKIDKKNRNKIVICYDKEGNKKRRYASIKEAAADIGWTRTAFTKFTKQNKEQQIKDRGVYYTIG